MATKKDIVVHEGNVSNSDKSDAYTTTILKIGSDNLLISEILKNECAGKNIRFTIEVIS